MDLRPSSLAPPVLTPEGGAEVGVGVGVGVVLSVVVPMYKESARVGETLADLVATLGAGAHAAEVILVDDGSPDSTVAVVQPWLTDVAHGNLRRVVLVRHAVNRGKGAAVRTGLAAALEGGATGGGAKWILMMDADNAARVREVERLWPHTKDGSGGGGDGGGAMVCGSRNTRDARVTSRAFRRLSGGLFRLALGMLGLNLLRDTQCGFKLYRADVARAIVKLGREDRFAFDLEHLLIASRLGPIAEVGIAWEHKDGGTVSPVRDGLKMLREAARIRGRFLTARGLDAAAVRAAAREGTAGAIGEIEAKPQAAPVSAPV